MKSNNLALMIALCGEVTLVNDRGFFIVATSVACGDIGVYDTTGRYYSFVTLRCDGFTVGK